MAISASRYGSLPLSSPSLYSTNVTQSADILKPVELPDLDQLTLLGDHLKAAFKKTLAFDCDQPDEGLNIDHCITILEELQRFQLHTITMWHITPAEYVAVLSFTSESPIEIKAKSDYFPDTQEVEIMSPSPVHEIIITWLHKCFITYSSQISHNDQYIDTQFFMNNWLPDEESLHQVPDIMGVVHCVDQLGNDKSFVQWLVEVGFSQSDGSIMRKFVNMVKNNSDIKKLIKISIDEDGTFQGPKEHTEVTKLLHKSGSLMNCEKFKSLVPPKTSDTMYGPVVVGGHNWLKLKASSLLVVFPTAVRITVYLKDEASGKFRFDWRDPEHYAEGTLIPGVNMVNVDRLLNMSAVNLKAEIISIMEEFRLEKSMIDKARDSKPKLLLNWSATAMQMSSAICDTAFFRYVDWYNYKYNNKCKGATTTHTTEVSGKSSQAITPVTLLASGSTEHNSKKPKVSQEKETKKTSLKKKKAGSKGKSWTA
ncbi:hypothetical protein F4604DRAFT_1681631 [Suillus subluteus]|nr:hypothetical protein F4604DRAFT_1681631 [Suillus subluteus]